MPDQKFSFSDINWRKSLPFTHLFRAFRIAAHPAKLILAMLAIILIYAAGRGLDAAWPDDWVQTGASRRMAILQESLSTRQSFDSFLSMSSDEYFGRTAPSRPFQSFLHTEMELLNSAVSSTLSGSLGYPRGTAGALLRFLVSTPWDYWQANQDFFSLLFFWTLLIIALFGGAVARIAAVQVARDEQVALPQALRFSWRKLPSFFGAPILPVFTALLLGVALSLGGLLVYIPAAGPIVVALGLFLALAVGVLLSMIAIGGLFGWPLMYPTIAVEASDAFDATSRSYSYVVGAPWRLLFYWLVTIVLGAISYLFVKLFVFVALVMSRFFVGWGVLGDARSRWELIWPAPRFDQLTYIPVWDLLQGPERVAATLVCIWVYLLITVLGAFALSYFISASTIIYYLLRRQVDVTEMDEVFIDAEEDEVLASAAEAIAPMPPATTTPPAPPQPPDQPSPAVD